MAELTVQEMFDAGSHFGHQTKKWNPKMKPYLYGARSGIHIIDLEKSTPLAHAALKFVEEVVARGESVLFVGTKVQARMPLEEEAKRSGMLFMTQRWLGGTLTNFQTIKKGIERLVELETRRENNDFAGFTKKELLMVDREIGKLNDTLGGIRTMRRLPGALFIVDPFTEKIAVHEANVLGIPIIAVTDSNCNPDPIDFVIPANDDAIRSVHLIASRIADACLAGVERRQKNIREDAPSVEGKRPARKTKEVGGSGKAYVSKVDTFEASEAVGSFSAEAAPVGAVKEEVKEEAAAPKEETVE